MHNLESKERFIQLRAAGASLRAIAEELNIAKSTLCIWNKELADQITESRRIELEAVMQEAGVSSAARIKALAVNFQNLIEATQKYPVPGRPFEARVHRMLLQYDRRLMIHLEPLRKGNGTVASDAPAKSKKT